MPGRDPFEYVVFRVVPRVERGEYLNAGVMLICRPQCFLAAQTGIERSRLEYFAPFLGSDEVDDIEAQLESIEGIAAGQSDAGPIADFSLSERWHWLSSPSSTVIQPSPVHTGLCVDPAAELQDLFKELVSVPPPSPAGQGEQDRRSTSE